LIQVLIVPLSEDHLLLNIVSFNFGIELGQITALVFMLFIVKVWRSRSSFPAFSMVSNYSLMCLGIFLFFMQMHGYTHQAHAEEHTQSRVLVPAVQTEVRADTKNELKSDVIEIVIPARDSKEYKFHLSKGERLSFDWKTNGSILFFDFHGEPDGAEDDYYESFNKGTSNKSIDDHISTFNGNHGWYWKNKTTLPVKIHLKISGNYRRLE
jgi:hypothetical protein